MNKPTRSAFILFAIGILLAACASSPPKPVVDFKADHNFSSVKKIAFYDKSGQVIGSNPLQLSDMQRDRINEALSYALTNRGFQMVTDAAQADLLLSWSLITEQMTSVQTWNSPAMGYGAYYGHYNRYSGYSCWSCFPTQTDVTVQNYTRGTFIVDLIDPALRKSVWRSVIQSRLKGNQNADQDKYNETATVIFATFPPGASAPQAGS